jgi:hypothetical protein
VGQDVILRRVVNPPVPAPIANRRAGYQPVINLPHTLKLTHYLPRLRDNGLIDEIAGRCNIKADTLRRVLSGDMARVIAKCLDKDPARRYPSPAALADDIDRYLRGDSVLAAPPNTLYRVRKWLRKHRAPAAIAAVVLAAAANAFLWLWRLADVYSGAPRHQRSRMTRGRSQVLPLGPRANFGGTMAPVSEMFQ